MPAAHTALPRRTFLGCVAGAAGACALPRRLQADEAEALHEAAFYTSNDNRSVTCGLCPRGCTIPPFGRGVCGVRKNEDGKLVSLVYGRPVALNNDPIEKKPLFHVLPGSRALSLATVGCNIHCKFCQNWDISQKRPEDAPVPFVPPERLAAMALRHGSQSLAFTYNEPTIFYEYMRDTAHAAGLAGLRSVVISNGYIQARPLRALIPELTAYKVDLKAFSERFYGEVCNGALAPVLETLKRIRGEGLWLEIVVLVIPTLNDSAEELKKLSGWVVKHLGPDVPVHFTRFHAAYKLRNLPPTPPATLSMARRTAMQEGIHFVYTGNLPGNEGEHTFCPSCKQRVIERYGHRVLKNALVDGRCPGCQSVLPGVWI